MNANLPPEGNKTKAKSVADLSKDQQAEIKTGQAMADLQNLEGWKFYTKVLNALLDQQRNNVEVANMLPGESGDAYALRMERAKGTIIGLRLALSQPSIMITTANELRNRLLGSDSTET